MSWKVYTAGPLGFNDPGRLYHETKVIPALTVAGFAVLDPWPQARQLFMDSSAADLDSVNRKVGKVNEDMIRSADALLAFLDGTDVDSGTAAEIGFAAALGVPIVGVRTDVRMAGDNISTPVNLQVAHFIRSGGGLLVTTLSQAVNWLVVRAQDA